MKQEFEIISSLIEKIQKYDVGCGNGELMKYILDNISNIRGLEISKKRSSCMKKV